MSLFRLLTEEKFRTRNDIEKSERHYAKKILPGEIGCTLSHQKCYRKVAKSDSLGYVLILEDDIVLKSNLDASCRLIEPFLQTENPTVILLSGWYWFTGTKKIDSEYKLAKVYNAFLTQSYAMNRAAAKILIEEKPFIRADDWRYIRHKGVEILALLPHVVNQNWSGALPSTFYEKNPFLKGHLLSKLRIYNRTFFMKVLNVFGHSEAAE